MCRFPDERNEAILDVAKKRRITDQCKTEELLKASFSVMLKDPLAKGLTVTKPLLKWIAGTAVCEVINNTNLDIKVGPGEVIQRVYPVMMVEPSVSNNIIKEDWFSESRFKKARDFKVDINWVQENGGALGNQGHGSDHPVP